jgi:hypothetical protein
MDDNSLVEMGYTPSSLTMSAVVACVLFFGCAVVFCFSLCLCCWSSGGESVDSESFLESLLRMHICSTIQRIEDLMQEEVAIRMRLMEEGEQNNAHLQRRLEHITGKLEKAKRRLEEFRREADLEAIQNGASSHCSKSPTDLDTSRKEIINKNMIFNSFEASKDRIEEWGSECTCSENEEAGDGYHSNPECIICLNEYHVGDLVAKSKKGRCVHQFHKNCIMLWLRNHDHCPLCRTRIVERNNDIETEEV